MGDVKLSCCSVYCFSGFFCIFLCRFLSRFHNSPPPPPGWPHSASIPFQPLSHNYILFYLFGLDSKCALVRVQRTRTPYSHPRIGIGSSYPFTQKPLLIGPSHHKSSLRTVHVYSSHHLSRSKNWWPSPYHLGHRLFPHALYITPNSSVLCSSSYFVVRFSEDSRSLISLPGKFLSLSLCLCFLLLMLIVSRICIACDPWG